MQKNKIRVAVLFGGRSGEHEVSLRSAASIINRLDSARFQVIPVGIRKSGECCLPAVQEIKKQAESGVLNPIDPKLPSVPFEKLREISDVVFPALHGTYCEDGTLQGVLEQLDLPYVGCGVLASAVGMDKDVAKRLALQAGIPVTLGLCLRFEAWKANSSFLATGIADEVGMPCFVKPANSGSSVGVHKVSDKSQLKAAIDDAFRYDLKVLIEKGVPAREIELAVLEGRDGGRPRISIAGEIVPTHDFYSYEAKYLDEHGAGLVIPADLSAEQKERAQWIALHAFEVFECEGMARVDLFLNKETGELFLNEINTLPGFTSISMYPKLWEATGLAYGDLLTELVDLALARFQRRKQLVRDFSA